MPIVEPEVLMDGDHTIERSYDVTADTLHAVFHELYDQRVELEGMLLKPNMVLSGYDAPSRPASSEVAEQTIRCFRRQRARRRCPGSSSSPAARATSTRPRT